MLVHKRFPCKTCPFRKDATARFDPNRLQETVWANIAGQQMLHHCHKHVDREDTYAYVCVGTLMYIREHGIPNQNLSIGEGLKVIDLSVIPEIHPLIELDWEAVLDMHDPENDRLIVRTTRRSPKES